MSIAAERVLVTGGAGFVGSHRAKHLAKHGHEVYVLDSLQRGHRDAVRWGDLIVCDLCDRDAVFAAVQSIAPHTVLHFAGLIEVGESMRHPGAFFRANVTGTQNLLYAMLHHGTSRIVFSSTCATYGLPDILPITEEAPRRPVSPYGRSKLMVEQMLEWYGRVHHLRWAALRYFNVAGCDPTGELGERHDPETHLIPLAIDAALNVRPPLTVFGTDYATPDRTAVRDYIHVMDLVEAHRLALELLQKTDQPVICNLGTGAGASVRQVLDTVAAVAGLPVPHELGPRRPGDPPQLVADPSLARRLLGWRPQFVKLAECVTHAWDWRSSQ